MRAAERNEARNRQRRARLEKLEQLQQLREQIAAGEIPFAASNLERLTR
jgi:hypothetical protein